MYRTTLNRKHRLSWNSENIYHHALIYVQVYRAECSSSLLGSHVVRHPSVFRKSVNLHNFDFSPETAEQNSMKLDRKQCINVLLQVCVFRTDSDLLRYFRRLLWNCCREFDDIWQEARSQRPILSLYFRANRKTKMAPGLWLTETFSTFPANPQNRIWINLAGSKIERSSTTFVFFGPTGKKWLPRPLIGWDKFDYFSETA